MQEMRVRSLGQEDAPKEETATYFSTLAWKIPWTDKPGGLQSMGSQIVRTSRPITAWQREGEKVEVVTDFLFLGSKITMDSDCSHEIRRQFLLGRKAMTNPASVLKSRDITLLTKVCIVKAMVFPVVMHGCES